MKAIRIAALGVALLAGSTAIAGAQATPQAPAQQGGPGRVVADPGRSTAR